MSRADPDMSTGTSEEVFFFLAIRGPTCGLCDLPSHRVIAVASFGYEDEIPMSNLRVVIIFLFLV